MDADKPVRCSGQGLHGRLTAEQLDWIWNEESSATSAKSALSLTSFPHQPGEPFIVIT